MGYHVMDLFYEYLAGIKDFDEFLDRIKTISNETMHHDLLLDLLNVCIRRVSDGSGSSFLSVVHDMLIKEYDDVAISVKLGKEITSIEFAKDV